MNFPKITSVRGLGFSFDFFGGGDSFKLSKCYSSHLFEGLVVDWIHK
jgi:hypothetical protein